MILNKDELRAAIMKIAGGEAVRLEIEARLQQSSGPEAEGLLIVTPTRLLFAHRPPFSDPQVEIIGRSGLEIASKQEDLWGATLKARAGGQDFELRRIVPSDFKQLCAELEGSAAGQPEPPPTAEPQIPEAIIEEDSAPIAAPEAITFEPIEDSTPISAPQDLALNCYRHPGTPLETLCDECGKPICGECSKPFHYKIYCPDCLEKVKIGVMKDHKEEKGKEWPAPPERTYPWSQPQPRPAVSVPPPVKAANCYIHPQAPMKSSCDECGKSICADCVTPFHYKTYCPNCMGKVKSKIEAMNKHKSEVKKPWPPPPQRTFPSPQPPPLPPERFSHPRAAGSGVVESRSPALAFLFSFMPGFGQFYNKEYGKGVVVLLTFPLIITWLWGFTDAVGQARKHNEALGISSQPAGCFAFLLTIFPVALVFLMSLGIYLNQKENSKADVVQSLQLKVKQEKVQTLLKEFSKIQQEKFEENKSFLDYIPDRISSNNDTGYTFEIIMLGKDNQDFRAFAWAAVGDDHKLDLWSVGSGGFVAHEYAPEE